MTEIAKMTEIGKLRYPVGSSKRREVVSVPGDVPLPVTEKDFKTEEVEEECLWSDTDDESSDEIRDEILLSENQSIISREVVVEKNYKDKQKPKPKKKEKRVKVIREIIHVKETPEPVVQEPKVEPEKKQKEHVKIQCLPTRIGNARDELLKSIAVVSEEAPLCPVCDIHVLQEESLVRYAQCGHYAHFDCATSAIESLHVNKCLTCLSEEIEETGAMKCYDVIEGATRLLRVPNPNGDSTSILAGHHMHPLTAMYHLCLSAEESKNEEVSIVSDELGRQVAHVYADHGTFPEPNDKVEASHFTEQPKGLKGFVKTLQRGMRNVANPSTGAAQYHSSILEDSTMENMMNSGEDIERIMGCGYDIRWVRMKRLKLDLFVDCQYGVTDLRRLGATRDDLIRMGLELRHLNRLNVDDLEKFFNVDATFVFKNLAQSNLENIGKAKLAGKVLKYYNMTYEWMMNVGIHPHGWDWFSYLSAKEFRDDLGFNTTVFTRRGDIAMKVIGVMGWSAEVLRDIFNVISDEPEPPEPIQPPPQQRYEQNRREQEEMPHTYAHPEYNPPNTSHQQTYYSQPDQYTQQSYVNQSQTYNSGRMRNSDTSNTTPQAYYPPPRTYNSDYAQRGHSVFMSPFTNRGRK